jgi:uncharacterized protein (DUF1330 family)
MPVTVLALTTLRPGGDAALAQYLAVVGPLMQAAGARLLSRHPVQETLAGAAPDFVSLVEYPDRAALAAVFDHPDYRALQPVKDQAFTRYEVCVLGD